MAEMQVESPGAMLPKMDDEEEPKQPEKKGKPKGVSKEEIETYFKDQIVASERDRRQRTPEWKRNVELRMGKPTTLYTAGIPVENDDVQSAINPDWALTKTKTANLASQVPTVRAKHEDKKYAKAVAPFIKSVNYELSEKRTNIGASIEECLNDVVNASGIAAMVVSYAARFDTVMVPEKDSDAQFFSTLPPEVQQRVIENKLVPLKEQTRTTDYKFGLDRISPNSILWPSAYRGSDYDKGPWIGYEGLKSWAEGSIQWGLKDEDRDKATGGGDETRTEDDLRANSEDRVSVIDLKSMKYKHIFYWRYRVDPECKSFSEIWEIVFVEGLSKPVVHEKWKGQRYDEQLKNYVGARRFPVRILTLTYITDNPVPPSDSSAGRPQVRDMLRSRDQMFKNRMFSTPLRWADSTRVDPEIMDLVMRGTWQGMIPSKGDGTKSFGEVARASYPAEDFAFDRQNKADLMEIWQIGPEQLAGQTQVGRNKAEVQMTQANFATRIGQERGRVASFFLSAVEVLAGLMVLYSDFPNLSQEEKQVMNQAWDFKHVLPDVVLSILPDAMVMLDSNQRIQRGMQLINMTAKSGFVNVQPIIEELIELSGYDPSEVMMQPQPKQPEEPNMSFRFTGKEDIYNPLVLAMAKKRGQLPSPEEIEDAKHLLLDVQQPAKPRPPQQPGQPQPGQPHPGQAPPQGQPAPHPQDVDTNKDWNLPGKVAKRSADVRGA